MISILEKHYIDTGMVLGYLISDLGHGLFLAIFIAVLYPSIWMPLEARDASTSVLTRIDKMKVINGA